MNFGNHQPLEPHVYPVWILLGISSCLTIFILFLFQLPFHFQMNAQFKQAECDFQALQYAKAYASFEKLLKYAPECRHVRLRIAESLFCIENREKHVLAFKYLEDVKLNNYEWTELQNYMPDIYCDYFKRVKKS
jgi:predicted Zn-dependent protease